MKGIYEIREYGKAERYTEQELINQYGYLMNENHEMDIGLLVDILIETGLEVDCIY